MNLRQSFVNYIRYAIFFSYAAITSVLSNLPAFCVVVPAHARYLFQMPLEIYGSHYAYELIIYMDARRYGRLFIHAANNIINRQMRTPMNNTRHSRCLDIIIARRFCSATAL